MQNFCFILVVLGLFGVVVIATTQDCRFPGIVGCRFNDEICLEDEECIDDRLFGNCQKVDSVKNFYSYALTISQLQQLEEEVRHLVKEEYEWQDLYTQCVLTSMLLSFRCHRPYDRSLCNGEALAGGAAVAEAPAGDNSGEELSLKEKAARLLQMYLKDYYDDLQAPAVVEPDVDTLDFDDGRDDRVIIHKYKKARKRIVPEELNDEDYANLEALLELSPSELQQLSDYLDEQEGRVASLESSENDLQRNGNSQELFNSREEGSDEVQSNDNDDDDDTSLRFPVPSDRDSLEKIFQTDSEENMNWSSLSEDDARSEHLETEDMETTPEDVRVLKQLLKGEKDVSSIERSQGKRLERLIMEMIADLKLPSTTSSSSSSSESVIDTKTAEVKNVPSEVLQQTAEGMSEPVIAEEDNEEIVKKAQPSNVAINKPEAITTAPSVEPGRYKLLDTRYGYLTLEPTPVSNEDAEKVMAEISSLLKLNPSALTDLSVKGNELQFGVAENLHGLNASQVVYLASSLSDDIYNKTGYRVQSAGIGRDVVDEVKVTIYEPSKKRQYLLVTFVLCAVVVSAVIIVLIVYIVRYHAHSKKKLAQLAESGDPAEASKDLQDLCRQRMLSKSSEKPEPLNAAIAAIQRASSSSDAAMKSPSSRGSTSSWSEEPVTSSMDITTGHIVLSYMEDHLQDKERLNREWEALSAYEAEPNDTSEAISPANLSKNRYSDILPYDHSRVVLNRSANASGSDYINASFITDHDPRNPAYIVTQGPLFNTIADFWQMVWEQGSVVIVNLTKLSEGGRTMCHRYWPEEGSEVYHSYEVHLVSEHIWCDDYLVRSFYLKNLLTGETRTVTQFHYLTWHDLSVPNSVKTLLDFRRKVNKSYRGRSCPIIVHCSDGAGRTGTYCLVDLVLNRMNKGAKEIDMAASLEHIRDQRMCLVKSKEQFEFALAAVAEEVHAILKALPQQ